MITTELGVSLRLMFDFDKLSCFQGTPEYLFSSYCEWIIVRVTFISMCLFEWKLCLFVSYDKFLAMWLVSEFFRFSKVESVSTFFSPRLLLRYWYYCVTWCISGEKSLFVRKRLTSGKPALLKVTLLHGCFSCFLNCTNGTKRRKTFATVSNNK